MDFRRYVCWQADQVHQILNPDAEDVANEVFLAVHSEHPLWMVDPTDLRKRWSQPPRNFVADFLAPSRTHVQAAVIGESGSGKSHLIHWMSLNIPHRDDQYVLSIPRSGTSLRGILERIVQVLHLMENLLRVLLERVVRQVAQGHREHLVHRELQELLVRQVVAVQVDLQDQAVLVEFQVAVVQVVLQEVQVVQEHQAQAVRQDLQVVVVRQVQVEHLLLL